MYTPCWVKDTYSTDGVIADTLYFVWKGLRNNRIRRCTSPAVVGSLRVVSPNGRMIELPAIASSVRVSPNGFFR